MSSWLSVGIIQTEEGPKVLQQEVKTSSKGSFKPKWNGEHRLVKVTELDGIMQLHEDIEVVP